MSLEDDFSICTKLGVDAPCYLRSVVRRSRCGDKTDSSERRAALLQENVLSEDDGILSVFFVTNSQDVIRTALALNWCRTGGSRVEDLCLLAFAPDELEGISKEQTPDQFICDWAKRHHWNITLTGSDQERVASVLANRNRFPNTFTKSKMKSAHAKLFEDGCRSVRSDSSNCVCEHE